MCISQLKYWVWLSTLKGIGAVTAAALLRRFGTPESVYTANSNEYHGIEGVKQTDISGLLNKDLGLANKTLARCAEIGCRIITLQDADYPDRLRNIYDPPIIFFVRGNLPVIDEEPAVAIVGTRECTPYGIKAAETMGYELACSGIVVVTGLARGIDSAATRGALRGGGRVVGVIGSGLDIVYPHENRALFEDVSVSGAIVSEYPPGTRAMPGNFPARNRIISGMSLGVAVIEAPKKSGALITAARALEQGRDIFALPGNIDAQKSEGSNSLLREGAIPILSAEDIISEYKELYPDKIIRVEPDPTVSEKRYDEAPPNPQTEVVGNAQGVGQKKEDIDNTSHVEYIDLDKILGALDADERPVVESIGGSALGVDEIIVRSGLPAQQVLSALTMLEIKGYAARHDGLWSINVEQRRL